MIVSEKLQKSAAILKNWSMRICPSCGLRKAERLELCRLSQFGLERTSKRKGLGNADTNVMLHQALITIWKFMQSLTMKETNSAGKQLLLNS